MDSFTHPGIVPPPPGATPDLENPHDAKYSLLLGWLCACSILATIFFLIRAYVKICIIQKILTEDSMADPAPTSQTFGGTAADVYNPVTCGIAWVRSSCISDKAEQVFTILRRPYPFYTV